MQRDDRKSDMEARSENELLLLDKSELARKCVELKSTLDKVQQEIATYRALLIKSSEEYQRLKAKNLDITQTEYDKTWSWVNKIVFVLKKVNRPLLSSEIIEFVTPYELGLQYSRHRAQAFSANLNKAVKYGRVQTFKLPGSRGYYYVLPNWLGCNGHLTNEYENKIFFK